jgi:hypothetical protein
MPEGWVFLRVGTSVNIAVPVSAVHRVLHGADEDYAAYAPTAADLSRELRSKPDSELPGVLVLLENGSCWYVGDVLLGESVQPLRYESVPSDLFERTPGWCRGILWGRKGRFFVVAPEVLGGKR